MIKIQISACKNGNANWRCAVPPLSGFSRTPLFDACRELKRAGADPAQICGLFWPESEVASISCPIWAGAKLTVLERARDKPRFALYREFQLGGADDDE